MVVMLIFPNIKHINVFIYIYTVYMYCIYIHLPAFHLSHPLQKPRYQDIGAVGTQCAVRRLEGLLETGEICEVC